MIKRIQAASVNLFISVQSEVLGIFHQICVLHFEAAVTNFAVETGLYDVSICYTRNNDRIHKEISIRLKPHTFCPNHVATGNGLQFFMSMSKNFYVYVGLGCNMQPSPTLTMHTLLLCLVHSLSNV